MEDEETLPSPQRKTSRGEKTEQIGEKKDKEAVDKGNCEETRKRKNLKV